MCIEHTWTFFLNDFSNKDFDKIYSKKKIVCEITHHWANLGAIHTLHKALTWKWILFSTFFSEYFLLISTVWTIDHLWREYLVIMAWFWFAWNDLIRNFVGYTRKCQSRKFIGEQKVCFLWPKKEIHSHTTRHTASNKSWFEKQWNHFEKNSIGRYIIEFEMMFFLSLIAISYHWILILN